MRIHAAWALAASLVPVVAQSQACLGLPSNPTRVAGAVSLADSSRAYSASLGGATPGGVFGDVGLGRVTYDYATGGTVFGFAEGGARISPPGWRLHVCPIVGASYGVGPKGFSGTGTDVSISAASAGLAFGLPLGGTRGITLVPNAIVSAQVAQTKVSGAGLQPASATGKSGLVDAGVAFLFGERLSLAPAVQIPFASDDNTRTVSLTVAIALGRR